MNAIDLFIAAKAGKTEVLDHPDVSTLRDERWMTPLHYLAIAGVGDVIRHKDCSIVRCNTKGFTPLHLLACSRASKMVLQHLDVATVRDTDGNTPLHLLSMYTNDTDTIMKILEHPGVSSTKENTGNTPLHMLAVKCVPEILFNVDANVVKNDAGMTPEELYCVKSIYMGANK